MTDKVLNIMAKKLMIVEGGLTMDPRDKGNWTGGKVGVGELKGSNFGISAAAYPNEDIKNMTMDRALYLFKRDYWDKYKCNQLKDPMSIMVSDFAYNSGIWAIKILQKCLNVKQDGIIGPITIGKCNSISQALLIENYKNQRMQFLRSLPSWSVYGKGWTNRVNEITNLARKYL